MLKEGVTQFQKLVLKELEMRRRVLDVEFWEEMNGHGMLLYFYFFIQRRVTMTGVCVSVCGPLNDILRVKN